MQEVVERRAGKGGGGGGEGKTGGLGLMSTGSMEENGGGEGEEKKSEVSEEVAGHRYDFRVAGPRNLSSPNWRDVIRSSWIKNAEYQLFLENLGSEIRELPRRNPNYKRIVIACFIQAVYLLELDRQEKRTKEDGLAPQWWKPFKYKLTKTLVDERDGSVYGAVLEWDRSAALSDFVLLQPSGAPKAVLALRGTLLKSPTIRRDLEDDLRFMAWESLKGSVRFHGALEALKTAVDRFGSKNVCIGGHSLGAGFALQVGKALATQGVFVECHLFNPPSVSLAMSVRIISEKAGFLWKKIKTRLPSKLVVLPESKEEEASGNEEKKLDAEIKKWVPNLYVNNSDYICCYYIDSAGTAVATSGGSNETKTNGGNGDMAAKLFVMSKGPKRFLEAHGLQQWWADDMELQLALQHSKLINRQLRSLYKTPPTLPPGKA